MQKLSELQIIHNIQNNIPIIDVRAPVEFSQGHLPNSKNIPILNNEERALVGTCYKQKGREAAIALGHRLVSDQNKKIKVDQWIEFIKKNPQGILTCFRGGLRSQIAQKFIAEAGFQVSRIDGGYKNVRQTYLDELKKVNTENIKIKMLTGETGCGKTEIIKSFKNLSIDLENRAAHRGSAFGRQSWPQPSQATFENRISHDFIQKKYLKPNHFIILEDESRVIGSLHLPESLFLKMRQSPVIQVVQDIDQRVQNIFKEYIFTDNKIYDHFEIAIQKISKKLGNLRANEIIKDIRNSRQNFLNHSDLNMNKIWIEKILIWYYDPIYQYSLNKRQPMIEFKGSYVEVIDYLNAVSS